MDFEVIPVKTSSSNIGNVGFYKSSVCIDKNKGKVFVFGGENNKSLFTKAAFLFDTSSNSWDNLTNRFKDDIKIDSHSCVFYDGSFYVYGGWDSTASLNVSKIYKIKVSPFSIDIDSIFNGEYTKDEEGEFPKFPCPRVDHTAVVLEDKMIIYGGRKKKDSEKILGDVWSFSFETLMWEKIGDFDLLRCCHATCYDSVNKCVLFYGGRNEKKEYCQDVLKLTINGTDSKLEKLKTENEKFAGPRERCAHVCIKNKFYIIGGWTFGNYRNDCVILDLENYSWSYFGKSQKIARSGAMAIADEMDDIFVIGGKQIGITQDVFKIELKE